MPVKKHAPIYKGRIRSTGYLMRNEYRQSDKAPNYKGRLYVDGFGWMWISGWTAKSRRGTYLSLQVTEMDETEVDKYCRPKGEAHEGYRDRRDSDDILDEGDRSSSRSGQDRDIPF